MSDPSVTPWIAACQAPLSIEFPRKEYWSALPFPSPEDLPDLGIEPGSPELLADSLLFELQVNPFSSYFSIFHVECYAMLC